MTTGTSAAPAAVIGQSTSANTRLPPPGLTAPVITATQVEDALFGYLQGMRALGRTKVDITEAARALGLPASMIVAAAQALKGKGVEVA
jgi:hypothetical protein